MYFSNNPFFVYWIMEPPKCLFKPIHFILDSEQLERFQCIICLQSSINLMQCRTCRKCLCHQCAIDQKIKNNKCPNRCSNGELELQHFLSLNLCFRCPFSPDCKAKLNSIQEFAEHDQKCNFISEEQKQQQVKKWEFKCNQNHTLQIYMDTPKNLKIRRQCGECKQYKMSRILCRKCNTYFCCDCRPFPIVDMKCPINHEFFKVEIKSDGYVCDLCELNPATTGKDFYEDYCCNMSLCQTCFTKLPRFNKMPEYCQNLASYCEKVGWKSRQNCQGKEQQLVKQEHKLRILPKQILQKCGWCLKQKLCYKECSKCKTFYCIQCKIFDILQNGTCQLQHKFYELSAEEISSPKEPVVCYICKMGKNTDIKSALLKDPKCKVILCNICYKVSKGYNRNVSIRLLPSSERKCLFGNHIVKLNPASSNVTDFCYVCQQFKKILLTCKKCVSPQKRDFCCSCYPPKNIRQCYCGKTLKKVKGLNINKCLLCEKQSKNQINGCQPCGYTICSACILKRQKSNQIKSSKPTGDIKIEAQ